MENNRFSIKYQESETPLKVLPKNAWVKIYGFKNPCRVLEVSMQSITLDIANNPEAKNLQTGQNILLHFLDISGENCLEISVTVFRIDSRECLCQIPLYVNNEQALIDKLILEMQKNEIKEKNFSSSIQNKDNASSAEKNSCSIPSEKDMASILNNLVAMLPDETQNSEDEKVTAQTLTDIPKSTYEYRAPFDPVKTFETADYFYDEDEDFDIEDDEEFEEDNDLSSAVNGSISASVHPLSLLRHSIEHKFLLDGLEDPYPEDSKRLNKSQYSADTAVSSQKVQPAARKKTCKCKKKSPQVSPDQFLPQNLLQEMNSPEFKAKVLSDQYQLYLNDKMPVQDKDAAFDQYYEFSSELPPELVFELAQKAKARKSEYQGLDHKYLTDEYGFTIRDEDDCDCSDGNENCIIGKFDKLLENKRTIEFNVNNDPNFVHKTKEEEDEAFIEKLCTPNIEEEDGGDKKINFNFNIDI